MIDRSQIGLRGPLRQVRIEEGQLRFFAKVIGEDDPVYRNDEAARQAGHPAIPAPPTFGFVLEWLIPDDVVGVEALGVPFEKLLHGEQEFIYHRPMYAGDTIALQTSVENIYDKKNGVLEFIEFLTTGHNQNGDLVLEMRNVAVIRHG